MWLARRQAKTKFIPWKGTGERYQQVYKQCNLGAPKLVVVAYLYPFKRKPEDINLMHLNSALKGIQHLDTLHVIAVWYLFTLNISTFLWYFKFHPIIHVQKKTCASLCYIIKPNLVPNQVC